MQLEYFDQLIPLLRNRFHIVALDLPGHGQSTIPRDALYDEPFFRQSVLEFIRALDLRRIAIGGESIGGTLALTIAAEAPELVTRVFALNPYDHGEKFGGGIRRSRNGWIIELFQIFRSMTIEARPALKMVVSGGFARPENLPPALFDEIVRSGRRHGYRRAEYQLYRHWRSWLTAVDLYEDVRAPVLLEYGEMDWSKPQEREDRHARITGSRLVTLPGTGHFSAVEDPQAVAALIAAD